MALVIDDLQNNRLYRKNIYLPTSVGNKKKHSAIFLMTPNYTSSISTMNYPFFINNNRYESYYTEKDISFVLTEDHRLVENSDDIPTEIQSGLLKCTMITCNTIEGFKQYSIPERIYNVGPVEQLTAYVFINTEDDMLEGYAMVQGTERIHIIETISSQLRSDILEFLMITYPISTAVTRNERDRLLYSSYGFEDNINNIGVMVLKTPVHESVSLTKMDMEIAIWEAQIKITQTIIKNFNNDNWMSHMYRSLKRKILKIPLKGYTDKIDDTVDSWENLLKDQKATLDFYLSVKAIEGKEVFDMSDIIDEYTDWVNKLTCPKSLKIKIINTVINSYKKNIKDYQYNLDRYRKLDEASKRVENVKALVSKTFSTWGFITTGPLSIVKSAMMKSILPKSQKKNVLSEAELEAKIELYTKIVENLEEKKKEIQSLEEISLIYDINSLAESYNISFTVITENKKYKRSSGESKDLAKARQFVYDVKMLAAKRNLPVFVVTNGASGISNNGCEAVKHARDSHIEWEKSHNEDPNEDWSDKMKHESVILETSNKTPEETLKKIDGFISFKQMRDNIYLVHRNRLYNDDGKNHKEDWLYILTDDNKIAGYMLLYNKNKEMYSLTTYKQYRNHGYATRIITCAVNDLGANFLSIKLSDENGTAHRLYLKLGFKEYDRNDEFIYMKIAGKVNENKYITESVFTENYIFSKDNLYINFDKFESGKTNVCFVTGLSGSGKSTLAGTLATKYKAEWIELDIFEHCSDFTDSQLKEAGEVFYDYLSSHKDLWDRLKKKEVKGDELNKEIAAFFKYAISWAHRHKSQKFIFEGVQIYSFGDKSFMKSQPIVFVNASMLKSIIQRFKRNGNGKVDLWAELKNEFPQMLSWYIDNERDFTKFKKAVLNESVLTEGTNLPIVYQRPYNRKEILDNYGKEVYDRLMKDDAHAYRADTGIELIHREPSKEELERIMANWYKMTDVDKKKSDKMSIKLFGKDNKTHYKELISESVLTEAGLTPLYFISTNGNLSNLTPRIPDNFMTKNGYEDNKTKRISFSTNINGCLMGLSSNLAGKEFYVYRPDGNYKIVNPTVKQVPDVNITNEVWICEPVKLQLVGIIKVNKDSGEPGLKYTYGKDHEAELYKWDWSWKSRNKTITESSKGKYYYVSNSREMDDGALFYSENGMGIYDSIENAIAAYPHKAYKLFVFDTDMAIKTEVLPNGKVKYDGSAGLNLIGSINVTYNRDGSLRSYDWNNKIKDGISVKESTIPKSAIIKDYVVPYIKEEASLTNLGLQTEDSITFLEGNNEVLVEADAAYNAVLRRILYSERIKNHKEIMLVYDQLKEDCPWIRFTYINYEKYMGRNLFIDWSYYTKSFFKNNIMRYDKAVNLYFDFVTRFLQDHRLTDAGYTKKSVIVPINDWVKDAEGRYWDYKTDLNPISVIYRLANTNLDKLKETWGDYKFIFTGTNGYFVLDFSKFDSKDLAKFLQNVKIIVKKEPIVDNETPDNSTKGIVNSVIDKLENNSNGSIQINNLTGAEKASEEELKDRIDQSIMSSEDDNKDNEEKLVDAITKAASKASNDDEVIAKIDNDDYIKQLVLDLKTSSPDSVQLEPTRVARVRKNTDNFRQKIVAGKSVSELLTDFNEQPLPETKIPIDSINEDWQHMTYINHNKTYNLDGDIVRCLNHFSNTTIPVSILDTTVEDKSTSEDWIYTWTVKCEDVYGKRFTLRFDIPKLVNNRTMHLRGNDKTINGQLMNLPILKTEENTCQMTSNYNKIFFSGYGTSTGKSYVIADRIIKTLNKIETSKDLMIELGDNTRISSKYDLPTDYIDISSVVSKVSFIGADKQTRVTLFFNQDEFIEKYSSLIKKKDELAYGIMEFPGGKTPTIIYYNSAHPISEDILGWLSQNIKFEEVYNTTSVSTRYTYSKASILSTDIPIAVMIGYYIGLIPMLDRANISYTVSDKRPKYDKNRQDLIRLSDAYIVYDLNYDSSMLLNGLKECDTAAYSLKDVNTKRMWVEFLDLFGGRLKADGLDMFYDLMIDPISLIVCEKYKLPTDYIDALLYANALLSDNKFNKHTDITGNRYRTNEIIAGYTYKALCNSYTQYRRDLRSGRDAKMTMKQSAVLDLLFADNTFGDLSSLSDLLEWESISSTSFKGLSGMNSDRAYGLDKRTFDQSMVNLLALSTGFSANTGVTRQSTIDMDIDTARGYVKNSSDDKMSITKTFCMAEALTPYGTTSDDPFRSAMTFIQTTKHGMRTKISDPLLVTNGADQALPYMTSNTFTYKTKNAGKVKEKTDDYMVLEYKDGSTEVVDLREKILKNSDGGMYIAVKLDTDLKVGNVFSSNEIVARDKISYSDNIGPTDHYSYNIGTFVKFAIINSDEGFEDSCIQTEWMADALSSVVVLDKEYTLPKDTTVHFMAKKGQKVQEGEPILIFQNSFDEEDANMLIKTLSDESGDDIISELGRIPIYSKVTGVIKDIKITRTVEIDELSPSLKKIVNDYEREVKKFNSVLDKYDPEKAKIADATYKLEPTGKLKNAANSVKIEFSLAYDDKFGVGDKVVCYSALKGVSKGKIAVGQEPYSQYRKDEKIHYIQSTTGDMKRMVGSINKIGALNKVMVELARQSCDIMGIKWKYFDEWDS